MVKTKLEKVLDERAVNRSALARMIGVHPATLSNWESGKASIPADKAFRIADIIKVDPVQLVDIENIHKAVA